MSDATDPIRMIDALEALGQYRILEKVTLDKLPKFDLGGNFREAVLIDTETTGKDAEKDLITEIAMLRFAYDPDTLEFLGVTGSLSMLEDPGVPITEDVTRVTGITNEMVAGKKIDDELVANMLDGVSLVGAHNSGYDRKMVERRFPGMFENVPWVCSMKDIEWDKEGLGSVKLDYLAFRFGMFYDAHRAMNDCVATLELLRCELPESGTPALQAMIDRAMEPTIDIFAADAPFDKKAALKERKYEWNDGEDGRPKAWHKAVQEGAAEEERQWLRDNIYKRPPAAFPEAVIDATTRYSSRVPRPAANAAKPRAFGRPA